MAETRLSAVRPRPRVAVVGGDTLLGKEVRELLDEAKPSPRIELIAAVVEDATIVGSTVLGSDDEDAIVMSPLTAESLTGSKVAFLAGSAASSRRALKANPADGPVLIDLTGALEEQPEARLRAPSAEGDIAVSPGMVQVIAHPASIAIAWLLRTLSQHAQIRKSIVHVFEPASERGKKGLDELQQQTVGVLTFQKLKTDIFDSQLAFNLLARYGEEAVESLDEVGARIERHLASLLATHHLQTGAIPMPSLQLVQAPVFHGHSFSVWVEFTEELAGSSGDQGVKEVSRWLSEADIDVRPDDPPSNANIAGQSGLSVGAIRRDPNQARAYWLWMVADNLRLAADNAVAVARELL